MIKPKSNSDRLIMENLALADRLGASAANKYRNLAERDDLIQEARLALVLAARRCDENKNPTAYIITTIQGAIKHYVRDKVRLVRVSRQEHERNRPPLTHASLDACLPCGGSMLDMLSDPSETESSDLSSDLEALVEQLPAADAAALRLTLLQGLSLRQAGEALGISYMTAQRRTERAVKTLKASLQA